MVSKRIKLNRTLSAFQLCDQVRRPRELSILANLSNRNFAHVQPVSAELNSAPLGFPQISRPQGALLCIVVSLLNPKRAYRQGSGNI